MGLVQDCDIIGQGLEAYHVCRVASVLAQGKMLNGLGPDISAGTMQYGEKHLQNLKMFAAIFPLLALSCLHDNVSSNWNKQAALHYTDTRKKPA